MIMARKPRQRAQSGVYYILAASADRLLFVDEEDGRRFAALLKTRAETDMTDVWAFSLQSERVHLVVKEGLDGVSRFVRDVLGEYAVWFNRKYRAAGRLFADRFKSLPLEDPDEILEAVRYVYRCGGTAFYADGGELALYAGGAPRLKSYMKEAGGFRGFERDSVSDADLLAAVRAILMEVGADRLDMQSEAEYLALLRRMLAVPGATVGQVSRVCGISRRQLEKARLRQEHN